MSSLEIYNFTATNYTNFISDFSDFVRASDFMIFTGGPVPNNIKDVNGNSINIAVSSTTYSIKFFKFANFCNNESTNTNYCLLVMTTPYGGTDVIHCVPACTTAAFYSDKNKAFTKLTYSGNSSIYSNFRAMKYSTDNIKFLSLGNPSESITLSTHVFKSIDDPTNTKTVLIVTDCDGYVSFYDSYTPYPWYVENVYHNGNNVGLTSSINAYKLAIKGYYCDNLYYFDGGYNIPGEGVSTIGGIKFLKLGDSNLFIKME